MENKTFTIEINGVEVLWFESEARGEAYAVFHKLCYSKEYSLKDISLINVQTDTELGHKFARKAG